MLIWYSSKVFKGKRPQSKEIKMCLFQSILTSLGKIFQADSGLLFSRGAADFQTNFKLFIGLFQTKLTFRALPNHYYKPLCRQGVESLSGEGAPPLAPFPP